jgi:CRISPR-associated protein Cas1
MFRFEARLLGKTGKPYGAADPINALFNYGYTMLESQCRRTANARGLDPYIGFNHEAATTRPL